jgi:hypothetical protein
VSPATHRAYMSSLGGARLVQFIALVAIATLVLCGIRPSYEHSSAKLLLSEMGAALQKFLELHPLLIRISVGRGLPTGDCHWRLRLRGERWTLPSWWVWPMQ